MMGVYMQRTFGDALSPDRAETQAVITFLDLLGGGLFVCASRRAAAARGGAVDA